VAGDFRTLGLVVELFFAELYSKMRVQNQEVELSKQLIIEDIEGLQEPHYHYVNELLEFFELDSVRSPCPPTNEDDHLL
jgi:hypothetical protein